MKNKRCKLEVAFPKYCLWLEKRAEAQKKAKPRPRKRRP